jgi:signal transduction histidine kinase
LKEGIYSFDKPKIERVLENLITNARDAVKISGGIKVLVENYQEKINKIHIEISDTGCGIKDSLFDQIFVPGFSSGKEGGNGLGLALAKKILLLHEGNIVLKHSEIGKGSIFSLWF